MNQRDYRPEFGVDPKFKIVRVGEEDLVFDRVREFAAALLDSASVTTGLALDLTAIRVLNSTAVGALMRLHGNLEKAGVPMAIVGSGPMIRDLFRMTRLDTYFNMADDLSSLPDPSEWEGLKDTWAERVAGRSEMPGSETSEGESGSLGEAALPGTAMP